MWCEWCTDAKEEQVGLRCYPTLVSFSLTVTSGNNTIPILQYIINLPNQHLYYWVLSLLLRGPVGVLLKRNKVFVHLLAPNSKNHCIFAQSEQFISTLGANPFQLRSSSALLPGNNFTKVTFKWDFLHRFKHTSQRLQRKNKLPFYLVSCVGRSSLPS